MSWRDLLKPEIQEFISAHHDSDLRSLALKKPPCDAWPYALIMDQIKVRQKAHIKTPNLYKTDGFIFPNSDLFEQASSYACSAYKTSLIEKGERFVDLTAGCGVDGFAFSSFSKDSVLVERERANAELLAHNACLMGEHVEVVHCDAESYVRDMREADTVFIDPQRRENGRKGFFAFEDCSPNIVDLLAVLQKKARKLIVKASPLVDIEYGIRALGSVVQVHVVQWQKECKEVLFVLDFSSECAFDAVEIIAVDLNDNGGVQSQFSFALGAEKNADVEYRLPQSYIYEPYPAFQKAGGFKSMALAYGLKKLHPHTHLYTSGDVIDRFPGRCTEVCDVVAANRKFLKIGGISIDRADVVVRNFPAKVHDLKKKLKLSDGGEHRIYASTLCNNQKKLILCKK